MLSPTEYAIKRRRELGRQRQRRFRERKEMRARERTGSDAGTKTEVGCAGVCHGTIRGFGTEMAQTERT